ncbi:Zinc finger CCCH domain-containing protein 17 [Linum grandiflorum]
MVLNTEVSGRLRVSGQDQKKIGVVCHYWNQGRCNRNPCRFVHGELPSTTYSSQPRSNAYVRGADTKLPSAPIDNHWRNSHRRNSHATPQKPNGKSKAEDDGKSKETVCRQWISGKCCRGDECKFSHAWCRGDGLSMMTRLDGHGESAVTGLSLPAVGGGNKLFSGGGDGLVQAWDSISGQIAGTLDVGGEIGCLVTEGDWLYLGLPSMVKARNFRSGTDYNLSGPTGQVYALELGMGFIFAGGQDGMIWSCKTAAQEQGYLSASLTGHTSPVVSLKFESGRLYSGSMDGTIKVWDGSTLQCLESFKGHQGAVMSLLFFDGFLLSCSLDCKIKVWSGIGQVLYTHEEAHGALGLRGVVVNGKPMLLCSWNNNSVGVYELPSFAEKGRLYTKGEVRSFGEGPDGMVFTGDAAGLVTVWRLIQEVKMDSCSICLEEMGVGRVMKLECKHVFHQSCLMNWLKTSKSCPLCRFRVSC